jgi:hypothetical protein
MNRRAIFTAYDYHPVLAGGLLEVRTAAEGRGDGENREAEQWKAASLISRSTCSNTDTNNNIFKLSEAT